MEKIINAGFPKNFFVQLNKFARKLLALSIGAMTLAMLSACGNNYAGKNLSGEDFTGKNLKGANFENAILKNVNFSGANLARANFKGADLSGANFGNSAKLEFRLAHRSIQPSSAKAPKYEWPIGYELLVEERKDRNGNVQEVPLYIKKRAEALGDIIKHSSVHMDDTGRFSVGIEFTSEGSKKFYEITKKILEEDKKYAGSTSEYERKQLLAIVFDGKLMSAPRIISAISDHGSITGDFSQREAKYFSDSLMKANLKNAKITGADLSGAIGFTKELLYSTASYKNKNLRGVNLSGLDLSCCDFTGQDLRGANLSEADLGGAIFNGADLRGANLKNAWSSDFSGAILE